MKDLILKADKLFSLFSAGDTVTVALSGGADSVALLHSLLSLKDELGITVNAAHLNHSIRGTEADNDQQFVENLCKKLDVKLFCEKIDVPQYAKDRKLSTELAAREVRYDFLNRVSNGKIATAHTASDNLETVIFNLSRGTALKGLCGIPPKRDNIIRPLIFCTRQDIELYCENNGLSYVTDSTNLNDDYSRNKIRHNVIPALKEINNNVELAAVRTADSLSLDNDFLDFTASEVLFKSLNDNSLLITDFFDLHPAIAKRVIKKYVGSIYPEISLEYSHINEIFEICLNKKGKANLPQSLFAEIKDESLYINDGATETPMEFKVNITKYENVNTLFANYLLDCDKIIGTLTVRTRKEGDSIRLYNRGCTKTLKKLFCENKVPQNIRDILPVIADENGIVWVYGIGVASRCAVTKNTKNVFKIEIN